MKHTWYNSNRGVTYMKTNEVLIAERNKRKITQRALALKSGVSNATISRIESGEVVPDVATLEKIATALNLDINYLLGRQSNTKKTRPSNLEIVRKGARMSEEEFATLAGVTADDVISWENGITRIDRKSLAILVDKFKVTEEYLLDKTDLPVDISKLKWNDNVRPVKLPIDDMEKIPLLGAIAAGTPIEAIENNDVDDYIYFDTRGYSSPIFALNIVGASMEPRIFEGDTAIIEVTGFVNTGEVAAVKVNGNDTTLKQVKFESDGMWLIGFNPSFKPIFYTAKECTELPVTVIGRLIEVRQRWK